MREARGAARVGALGAEDWRGVCAKGLHSTMSATRARVTRARSHARAGCVSVFGHNGDIADAMRPVGAGGSAEDQLIVGGVDGELAERAQHLHAKQHHADPRPGRGVAALNRDINHARLLRADNRPGDEAAREAANKAAPFIRTGRRAITYTAGTPRKSSWRRCAIGIGWSARASTRGI